MGEQVGVINWTFELVLSEIQKLLGGGHNTDLEVIELENFFKEVGLFLALWRGEGRGKAGLLNR